MSRCIDVCHDASLNFKHLEPLVISLQAYTEQGPILVNIDELHNYVKMKACKNMAIPLTFFNKYQIRHASL